MMKQEEGGAVSLARQDEAKSSALALTGHRTLFILAGTYTVSVLDRQILAILQEQIKHDLSLTDGQLGLLTGFSFAAFYAVFGILIGRLADRSVRRNVIIFALILWSFPTMLSGAAAGFGWLLLARVFVAIGEGGCNPAGYSLLSDIYPSKHRAAAISFFNTGANWGMLIGFLLGGWMGQLVGWRWTFVIVGIPGLIMAVLVRIYVKEPARTVKGGHIPTLREGLAELWKCRALRWLFPAAVAGTLACYAPMIWGASFFIRAHGLSSGAAGTWLAMVFGFGGMAGAFGAGLLADHVGARDMRWTLWVCAVLAVALAPLFAATFLATDRRLVLVVGVIPFALGSAFTGPSLSIIHKMTPPHFRATASALYLLATNFFGMGLGTWMIGIVSDIYAVGSGAQSIKLALLTVVPAAAIVSSILFYRAGLALPRRHVEE